MSVLAIRNVSKQFGHRRPVMALNDVSIDIAEGELLVLLGPSGCGKTTLLRSIAGLESPTGGSITMAGRPIVDVDAGVNVPTHKRRVGMVFQNYALWPHMTVVDNVAYPLRARGVKRGPARAEAMRMLELLRCGHLPDRYPGQLSGGQQQRIALGRSLVGAPETVLFDEPLSNVDAQLRREVRAEIRRLHKELGFTAVYVTHDQREGLELGDRIAIMRDGVIDQIGTPSEIYDRPQSASVARFLGVENGIVCRPGPRGVTSAVGALAGAWDELAPAGGGPFEVFVRSESLGVRPAGSGSVAPGECVIGGGTLADSLYGGSAVEHVVDFGDVRLFSALPGADVRSGEPVDCFFDAAQALVYPSAPGGPADVATGGAVGVGAVDDIGAAVASGRSEADRDLISSRGDRASGA